MPDPDISVVVPSHNRELRLRWLLNALEEQDLPRERWEVVVAHDSEDGGRTATLLGEHPLAAAGNLRSVRLEPGPGNSASRLRNAAIRETRAPLVAFTDDDCRPPSSWLSRALAAADRHPGAVVQGMTKGDPEEAVEERGGYVHRQNVVPPSPQAETCNIIYPRHVLDRVGGFVEDPPLAAGEDTDLVLRAQATGVAHVGAPEVLTYHAVQARSLVKTIWGTRRWRDLAWLYRRHPEIRGTLHLRLFWKWTHAFLPLAVLGLARARSRRIWLLLALPWYGASVPWRGSDPRGLLRALSEAPGRILHDLAETAAVTAGAIKHRWPVL